MRSSLTIIGALAILLASCAKIPTDQDANDAVSMLRDYGSWAWAVGIVLIWADLVLPVPQTAVIAALGIIYGTVLGWPVGQHRPDQQRHPRLRSDADLGTAVCRSLGGSPIPQQDGEPVQ